MRIVIFLSLLLFTMGLPITSWFEFYIILTSFVIIFAGKIRRSSNNWTIASIISNGFTGAGNADGTPFNPETVNLKHHKKYTRSLSADKKQTEIPKANDNFDDYGGDHITITVPKKVRIRAETAYVTPKAKTE